MNKYIRDTQQEWQYNAIVSAGYNPESILAEYTWWFNPTNRHSLRLTRVGRRWMETHSKFQFHKIELQEQILPKQLLQLERLLTSPYFIHNLKTIFVHSETDAIMLRLNGGNLPDYLDSLSL